ncbi:MAG: triose-phosphate isomerase [Patescibacteria group bacterium]
MKRKRLIAANWKMNPPPPGWNDKNSPYRPDKKVDIAVFPTHIDLQKSIAAGIVTGSQFARPEPGGAFTGDISLATTKELGCSYALCGHSDRRQFHHETNEFVAEQAKAALALGLIPVICIGETATEHASGKAKDVLKKQMQPLPLEDGIVIAYEPVWAISRGDPNAKSATPADAEEMHAFIRSLLPPHLRENVRILYGGSMNGKNAKELLSQPNIDGGLVGGASLKPEEFRAIVEAAAAMVHHP